MQRCMRTVVFGIIFGVWPLAAMAQNDICQPATPPVPNESRLELARIQAEERARSEAQRVNWVVTMVSVKNTLPNSALQPLCIFNIEVVPHSATKLVAIRAPKELIPAIEDALKRLDVQQKSPRTVELMAYVLVVAETNNPRYMPLPNELQAVANQLKSLLPSGTLFLADTLLARGLENTRLQVDGNANLQATVSVREGTPVTVRLDNLRAQVSEDNGRYSAGFNTSIDVPVGAQVVVGKAAFQGGNGKTAIVVMSAKVQD